VKTRMSSAFAPDYKEPSLIGEGYPSGTSMRGEPACFEDGLYAGVVENVLSKTSAGSTRSCERIKSCICQALLLHSNQTVTSCEEPFGLFLFAISTVVPL
jgi:hypothetical protein